ncbi:MAG: NAD(P)/FAD-dependent oxidoreductase [Ignavibacteria bacterium]|nr:NAD(P)/FAD-dependent oxidoreductase [Ignavibacteria bacterium]
MKKYKYIIIGGGMTGDAAVKGIRELDTEGSILMISNESQKPYARPPLSKGLWKTTPEEKIWKNTGELNVDFMLETDAESLNNDKSVKLNNGENIFYDKLLLATGGKVNKLNFASDRIIYYRTFNDYKKLRKLSETLNNFAVIGGGFIGTEIAAALAMNTKKVTVIFQGEFLGERVFPADLAEYVTDYFKNKGVEILNRSNVNDISEAENKIKINTDNGKTVTADAVIAGIGIKPNTALALNAGIEISNGINTDENLMTNIPDIYAAGDAANFYNPLLNKRFRAEHEDNANKMGKQAGRNMAGAAEKYNYLPFFYSDLFDLGYEAVGELDSSYEIVEDWKEKFKEGVIYYLNNNRVRGVLLWNVWGQLDEARKIIGEKEIIDRNSLIGRLPVKK